MGFVKFVIAQETQWVLYTSRGLLTMVCGLLSSICACTTSSMWEVISFMSSNGRTLNATKDLLFCFVKKTVSAAMLWIESRKSTESVVRIHTKLYNNYRAVGWEEEEKEAATYLLVKPYTVYVWTHTALFSYTLFYLLSPQYQNWPTHIIFVVAIVNVALKK